MSLRRIMVTAVRNLHPVTLSPRINIALRRQRQRQDQRARSCASVGARPFLSQYTSEPGHSIRAAYLHRIWRGSACRRRNEQSGNIADRQGDFTIRIDGQNARSTAQLAELLPLQLINPDSFRLLEGAPKVRRQFLDWGVFHVEPRFMTAWQRLRRRCGSGTHGCVMVHLTLLRKPPGTGSYAWPVRR